MAETCAAIRGIRPPLRNVCTEPSVLRPVVRRNACALRAATGKRGHTTRRTIDAPSLRREPTQQSRSDDRGDQQGRRFDSGRARYDWAWAGGLARSFARRRPCRGCATHHCRPQRWRTHRQRTARIDTGAAWLTQKGAAVAGRPCVLAKIRLQWRSGDAASRHPSGRSRRSAMPRPPVPARLPS